MAHGARCPQGGNETLRWVRRGIRHFRTLRSERYRACQSFGMAIPSDAQNRRLSPTNANLADNVPFAPQAKVSSATFRGHRFSWSMTRTPSGQWSVRSSSTTGIRSESRRPDLKVSRHLCGMRHHQGCPHRRGHAANGGSGDCRTADTRVQGVAGNRGAADSEWCQKKCIGRELR